MSWKKEAVVYQIYPRSFKDANGDGIGDIKGIIEQVPYLVKLGINAVWLSPVYASPMDDNGYDISDYCAIHPEFGTLDDLKTLIGTLHQAGIKLIMDLVFNHTSDEHPWFIESRTSTDNPKRDYYLWKKGRRGGKKPPNNWTSFFTGKAWTYDETTNMWYLHLFGKKQPDLNWEHPAVRQALKDVVRFWIDLGVDGFRLDVINLIAKQDGLPNGRWRLALRGIEHYANQPKAHEYLREFNEELFGPHGILTVGETVFVTPEVALQYVAESRHELDMVFHFEHMAVDTINNKWFIKPFKMNNLKIVLDDWQQALKQEGWNALYLENHDQPRSISRFGDKTHPVRSAKLLATLVFLQRGTPYIYQGQEIGMTNAHFTSLEQYRDLETHNIYKLGRKVFKFSHKRMMKKITYMSRDNARTPMQWTSGEQAGFSRGEPWIEVNPNHVTINVDKQDKDPLSVLNFYRKLIALRQQNQVFIEGDYTLYEANHRRLYVYTRSLASDLALVVGNYSRKTTRFTLPKALKDLPLKLVLSNVEHEPDEPVDMLKPFEIRVYQRR